MIEKACYSFPDCLVPGLCAFSQISESWCVLGRRGTALLDCAKVPLCGVLPTSHRMRILFLGRKSELRQVIWSVVLHSGSCGQRLPSQRSLSSGSPPCNCACAHTCSRLSTCLPLLLCIQKTNTFSLYSLRKREQRWLVYMCLLNMADNRQNG